MLVSEKQKQSLFYAVLVVISAVLLYVRWRHLHMPLERDEGEYAYGAQLLLQGESLYSNLYSLKWPGIFLSYGLIELLFGQSVWGIHFGVFILNFVTAYLIYRICNFFVDKGPASGAAVIFLVFTIQRELQGIVANSEHFVVFYLSLSLLFLLRYESSTRLKHLMIAGLWSGVALITKQHALGYILGICGYLLFQTRPINMASVLRRILAYGGGVVLPVLIVLFGIWVFDDFGRFWFHTITYARAYVGLNGLSDGMFELGKRTYENLVVNPVFWLAFVLSVGIVLVQAAERRWLLYPLLLGAFVSCSFGLYYRPHYMLLLVPVACLFLSFIFQLIWVKRTALGLSLLLILGSGYYFIMERAYLFQWDSSWTNYRLFYREPFREAQLVGQKILEDSSPRDRVLIIGAEPEINFYSQRRTVTGYIYTYPFFEDHQYAERMYEEWRGEVLNSSPKYIVLMGHWNTFVNQEHPVFKSIWELSEEFLRSGNYQLMGEVALPFQNGGQYWDAGIEPGVSGSDQWIRVYRREK